MCERLRKKRMLEEEHGRGRKWEEEGKWTMKREDVRGKERNNEEEWISREKQREKSLLRNTQTIYYLIITKIS